MSGWSDIVASGRGKLDLRLEVEGWPHEWVTSSRITHATNAAGRKVYPGLSFEGVRLSERAVMRDAWVEQSGMTVKIKPNGINDNAVSSFTRDPGKSKVCCLGAGITDSDSSLTTDTGATLTDTAIYHIATEALLMGAGNGIAGRGVWGTTAQHHSTQPYGQDERVPIYTWPPTMEGRRARLYAYGTNDSVSGDGTQIWIGVVSRPPRMNSDGVTWLIQIDPITKILEQSVSAAEVAYHPRGIYHSCNCPFVFSLNVPGGSSQANTGYLCGFYEDDNAFAVAVTSLMNTVLAASPGTGDIDSFKFEIVGGIPRTSLTTKSGSLSGAIGFNITGSVLDGIIAGAGSYIGKADGTNVRLPADVFDSLLAGSSDYVQFQGVGSLLSASTWFPFTPPWTLPLPPVRGLCGQVNAVNNPPVFFTAVPSASFSSYVTNRIYLDQDVTNLSNGDTLIMRKRGTTGNDCIVQIAAAPDATNNSIDVNILSGSVGAGIGVTKAGMYWLSDDVELVPQRQYGAGGSIKDFITSVISHAPHANDGDTPYILGADVDTSQWSTAIANQNPAVYMLVRSYMYEKPVSVKEIVCEDLKALGMMTRIGSDGRVNIIGLPQLSSTQTAVDSITDADIVTPHGSTGAWVQWEAQSDGIVNTVQFRSIYVPHDDDYDSNGDLTIRNTQSIAEHKTRGKGESTIAPKSLPAATGLGVLLSASTMNIVNQAAEIGNIISIYMGVLSQDYAMVTLPVSFKKFGLLVGDVVDLTSVYVPDGLGGRGVSGRKAFVVGREWPLDPAAGAHGTITLYVPMGDVSAGYTPSLRVSRQTNTSGNTWTLAADLTEPMNIAWSEAGDGDVAVKFGAGDKVRIMKDGDASFYELSGTVVTATSGAVEVTFTGTWTPGSDTWNLIYQKDTGSLTALQNSFTIVADTGRLLVSGGYAKAFA